MHHITEEKAHTRFRQMRERDFTNYNINEYAFLDQFGVNFNFRIGRLSGR